MIQTGRRIVSAFICLMICCSISLYYVFADDLTNAHPNKGQTLKVGYVLNYGILMDSDLSGQKGYGYDYLQKIAKYTGWKYEFIPVAWDEGFEMLKDGTLDLFGPLQKNPQREQWFDFPNEPLGYEYGALYADEDRQIDYDDFNFFDGMKVGTEKNNFYIDGLQAYCMQHGISVNFVYTTAAEFEKGLQDGTFDTILAGSLFDIKDTKIVAKISSEPYFMATTKGNQDILDKMNKAIKSLYIEDVYFPMHLYQKYYGSKSISNPAFTKEEKDAAAANQHLRVACDSNWALIQYASGETAKGISIDILNEIGKTAGLTFDYIPLPAAPNDITLGQQGEADLLIGYNMKKQPEDAVRTIPYLELPMLLVGTKTTDLKDHLNVAVLHDTSDAVMDLKATYPHFRYVLYDTLENVYNDIENGKVDLAFISTYAFDDFTRRDTTRNYITIPTNIVFPLDIKMSSELDPALQSLLNKSISRISKEQVQSIIFSNTVNRAYSVPFSQTLRENAFFIFSIFLLFWALIIATVVFNGKRMQKKLEEVAYVDRVTGIPSFARLRETAATLMQSAASNEYTIISFDIDKFQFINNTCGYQAGTEVLKAVGRYLSQIKQPEDLFCRVSADHFLLLVKTSDLPLLEKSLCQDSFDQNLNLPALGTYRLFFSIGAYGIVDPHMDIASMVDKANFVRRSVKHSHDQTIALYTKEMDRALNRQREVQLNMSYAIEQREFLLYLQPKYTLDGRRITGAEALVRWESAQLGFVMPEDFIPLFESNGFIYNLDLYMFEQVCRRLRDWKLTGLDFEGRTISVNLSEFSVKQTDVIDRLIEIACSYEISKEYLEIELTESFKAENIELVREKILKLQAAGFTVSVDDFGSGYSSLNLLKDLPADILKIDKAFLDETYDTDRGRKIIANVIHMAFDLEMEIVVEGVETEEQVQYLREMGCLVAQGYYFAKPMPADEFLSHYLAVKDQEDQ